MNKSVLILIFKEEGKSWENDKEFFSLAYNQGFEYDQDNEEFIIMETFNDYPYGDEDRRVS